MFPFFFLFLHVCPCGKIESTCTHIFDYFPYLLFFVIIGSVSSTGMQGTFHHRVINCAIQSFPPPLLPTKKIFFFQMKEKRAGGGGANHPALGGAGRSPAKIFFSLEPRKVYHHRVYSPLFFSLT